MLFGEPVYDGVSYFDALETGFSHAKAIRPIPPSALLSGVELALAALSAYGSVGIVRRGNRG